MWVKLHQKLELIKASGLDSWEAVPSSPFELDLRPGFFTGGFGLKGVALSLQGTSNFSATCEPLVEVHPRFLAAPTRCAP